MDADTLVNCYLMHLIHTNAWPLHQIQMEGWSCWLGEDKLMDNVGLMIREMIHGHKLQQFLDTHITNWLPAMAYTLVDWDAIGAALESELPLFKLWASKQASKFCGVGKQMCKAGFWTHNQCPCCNAPGETT